MSDTTSRTVAVLAGAAVLMLAVSGIAAAAAPSGSISANPATPDSTSTHTATEVVGNQTTGSWNGFKVDYTDNGTVVSNVNQSDIVKIGIDRGNNNTGTQVDVNVSDDVSAVSSSNNGHTLKVTLGGSYALHSGDQLVVVYSDVQNPSQTGSYQVTLDANPQSSGGEATATLNIQESSDTTTTEDTTIVDTDSDETTTQSTTTQAGETTTTQSGGNGGETTTQGSSPGFGLTVGIVAALGAAFIALRRKD